MIAKLLKTRMFQSPILRSVYDQPGRKIFTIYQTILSGKHACWQNQNGAFPGKDDYFSLPP